jgi:hypothetical protein
MLSNNGHQSTNSITNNQNDSTSSIDKFHNSSFNNNNNGSVNSNISNIKLNASNSMLMGRSFDQFRDDQETCLHLFDKWSPQEQTEFVENLLRRMCHFQHGHINNFLKPMLQRDFISTLPGKKI